MQGWDSCVYINMHVSWIATQPYFPAIDRSVVPKRELMYTIRTGRYNSAPDFDLTRLDECRKQTAEEKRKQVTSVQEGS